MVFEKEKKGHISRLEKKMAVLEDKLAQKNEQKSKNIFCSPVDYFLISCGRITLKRYV